MCQPAHFKNISLHHWLCLSHNCVLLKSNVFLFSSLAEVNTLSSDDGPLRWVPVIESVIPIVIHKKKVIQ